MAIKIKTTEATFTPPQIQTMRRRPLTTFIVIVVLSATTLLSAGAAVYFYLQFQDLSKNPTKPTDNENKNLIARVGKLMVLPVSETPTIATITDLAPFKDQPFFANAKVGYKVIIYSISKRAILYDPVGDKIVEVAPLDTSAPAPSQNTGEAPKK